MRLHRPSDSPMPKSAKAAIPRTLQWMRQMGARWSECRSRKGSGEEVQSAEAPQTQTPPEKAMQPEKEVGGIFICSVEQKKCEENNCGCWTTVKSKRKNRMMRVNKWKQFNRNALGTIPESNEKEVELNTVEKGNVQ